MTSKQKLDRFNDRLKKQYEQMHPYDLIEKGKKYDALKKRNDELLRLVRIVNDVVLIHSARLKKEIVQALKNNEND